MYDARMSAGRWFAAAVLGLAVLVAGEVSAEQRSPVEHGRFTIELLTMFPGDDLTTMTGHTALRVIDDETPSDLVYNWGALEWTSDLPVRFIRGPLTYHLAVYTFDETLAIYREENRTVLGQRLDLTQAQARHLVIFVDRNAQPENRDYAYHHFHDNCSTRVRDVIDDVTGGALRRGGERPIGQSYREQGYWRTGLPSWAMMVFDLIANESWDQPTTAWESNFLPLNLHAEVARAQLGDRPLVLANETYNARQGEEPMSGRLRPTVYVASLPALVLLIALIGLFLSRRWWRRAAKAGLVLLGLVAGLGGSIAVVAWVFTEHPDFDNNQMLFHCNPLDLALIVVGPKALGQRGGLRRWLRGYLLLRFALSVLALVALALGVLGQAVSLFAVPLVVAVGLALVVEVRSRGF